MFYTILKPADKTNNTRKDLKTIRSVRLKHKVSLAVLFSLGNEKPHWIHKAMIKYDITVWYQYA